MMPIDLRGFFFLFINNFTMSIQRKSITKRIFNLAFANKKKTRNWIKMRNDEFKNFICREVCTLKLNFPRFPSPQISIFMLFCDFPHCSPLHCIALKKSARVKIEWGKLKCNLASFREKRVKMLKSMEGLLKTEMRLNLNLIKDNWRTWVSKTSSDLKLKAVGHKRFSFFLSFDYLHSWKFYWKSF